MMDHPTRPDWEGEDQAILGAVCLGVVALYFLFSCVIYDIGGRDSREHPYSLPASVQQVKDYLFITDSGSSIKPDDLCWTALNPNMPAIDTVRKLSGNAGTLVVCNYSQDFNPKYPKRESVDFGAATLLTFDDWYFWAIVAAASALFCWPSARHVKYLSNRRKYNAFQKQIQLGIEEQRMREIAAAYARYEISLEEYDAGLERAYLAGVPNATEDN